MRDAAPITQNEVTYPDDAMLVSRTDRNGRITFVNAAFAKVSGFTEAELVGAPHNIVRHPDMPKQAFADLWATLKSGNPWLGLVKNRTKAGDYYWVRANVMPTVGADNGLEYVSLRVKPSREEVREAERIYTLFRTNQAGNLAMSGGRVVRAGAKPPRFGGSVRGRINGMIAGIMLLFVALAALGLFAQWKSDRSIETIYLDRVIPAGQLSELSQRMRDNLDRLTRMDLALTDGQNAATALAELIGGLKDNKEAITRVWDAYMQTYLTPEEAKLAQTFQAQRDHYVADGLMPALTFAEAADSEGLRRHIDTAARPLLNQAAETNAALIELQRRVSGEEYEQANTMFVVSVGLTLGMLVVGCVIALLLGRSALRAVAQPLARMSGHFEAIAKGDTAHPIPDEAVAEFAKPTRMLQAMHGLLAYSAQEKVETDRRTAARHQAELNALADTLEGRVKAIIDDVGKAAQHLADSARALSRNADSTRKQSQSVQEQANLVRQNVDSVAAAAQQLSAAEAEISRQVSNAAGTSRTAAQQAHATRRTVTSLATSATRIGEIVSLITEVAQQTDMLALNATIEATSAGAAGKGFAVVANEVKALAKQTARAAEDIAAQIRGIQGETAQAVEAINTISDTISTVSEVSAAVAAAVEQQGAATREIARSVGEAAQGTQSASKSVAVVASVALETESMAMEVLASADTLRDAAKILDKEVSGFLAGIRS